MPIAALSSTSTEPASTDALTSAAGSVRSGWRSRVTKHSTKTANTNAAAAVSTVEALPLRNSPTTNTGIASSHLAAQVAAATSAGTKRWRGIPSREPSRIA